MAVVQYISQNSHIFSSHYKCQFRLRRNVYSVKILQKWFFQLFLSNIKYAGLTHKVVPVRMYSVMAAQILDIKADLIYIDAAHDYQNVLDDIMAWHPHLTQGGVMCGDDWSLYEGVSKAVLQAAKELNVKVYGVDNFWWFEP